MLDHMLAAGAVADQPAIVEEGSEVARSHGAIARLARSLPARDERAQRVRPTPTFVAGADRRLRGLVAVLQGVPPRGRLSRRAPSQRLDASR